MRPARADLISHGADVSEVYHYERQPDHHDWWDWYAAYMLARQAGSTEDDAAAKANRYMAEVKHVVVSSA